MAITSTNHCNSFVIWWQNTRANIEPILPLFQLNPSEMSLAEIQSYQNLLDTVASRVKHNTCPRYARDIQAQVISTLENLQNALAAQSTNEGATADSYLLLARVKWAVMQATLAKHGIKPLIFSH